MAFGFGKDGQVRADSRNEGKPQDSSSARVKRLSQCTAIAVAIAFIGVCFAIWSYVDAGSKVATANAGRQPVLAMARTVEKGDIVEAGDLQVVDVPESLRIENALSEDVADRIVGKPAATKLAAGSQLTAASVAGEGNAASLADALFPGKEAVTIAVDAETGLSNLLCIDDVVRIMSTRTNIEGEALTTDLASSARVVALDGVLAGNGGDYASVTVEVVPEQATSIRAAQNVGTVTIVLESSVESAE